MAQDQPTDSSAPQRVLLPPFIVERDFLPADEAAALLEFALAQESQFRPSHVGYGEDSGIDPTHRVSLTLRDLGPHKARLRERLKPLAPVFSTRLKSNAFELSKIEIEMVAHGDGAFFGRHSDVSRDAFDAKMTRILSGIYYFHTRPKAFSGGALRLHELRPSAADSRFIDIEPEHNCFVVFPSWMPHEVMPVSCPSKRFADSRFSINCWFQRAG